MAQLLSPEVAPQVLLLRLCKDDQVASSLDDKSRERLWLHVTCLLGQGAEDKAVDQKIDEADPEGNGCH